MKQLSLLSILYVVLIRGAFAQETPPPPVYPDSLSRQRAEEERRMMDPALGRVPYERLTEEREKLRKQRTNPVTNRAAIPGMTWQERGPANGGGRTRAALFDPNDPTRKKVWVGSPMGGLWYTDDITDPNATWTPVSDAWENIVVTTIAADPANPQIMYAGTGGDYSGVAGGGIWKTSNGGTTWTRLNSSIPGGAYPSVGQSLAYIQRIVVNASGHVFVAGRYGVVRSTDGGSTWQTVLAPNQGIGNGGTATSNYFSDFVSDLEIGTDGIVYAAFNPGCVFRATTTAGTAWTEITPAGVPTGGERTELALAASTSGAGQVVSS